MIERSVDIALQKPLQDFLRAWGPVRWQEDELPLGEPDKGVGAALHALSTIERDSFEIFRKSSLGGVFRDAPVREFAVRWLAEEAEHARALEYLASIHGFPSRPLQRQDRSPGVREVLAWPFLVIARAMVPHRQAIYASLGVSQEYVALFTYSYLSRKLEGSRGSRLLLQMARQESRHLRFYSAMANFHLQKPGAAATTRLLLSRLWRPPGFDALGSSAWWQAFGSMIAEEDFEKGARRMDRIVDRLPGLDGMNLMAKFLDGGSERTDTLAGST